jgi:hypothetical protein
LKPSGKIVLILTRWSTDDIAGRILERMENGTGEEWEVLRLPAESEGEGDPLGYPAGEFLWSDDDYGYGANPEREKKNQDVQSWSSLFQGTPIPAGGTYFQNTWFKSYDICPILTRYRSTAAAILP